MSNALDVLHGLVLEDGARWGTKAAPFQREDAEAILAGDRRLHFLTRPRGASKSTDIAGVVLALLLEAFGPGDAGHVFAVDADQAGEVLRAASGFVQRTGELRGLIEVQSAADRCRERRVVCGGAGGCGVGVRYSVAGDHLR
jgi:hypothetical protein